MPKKLRDLCVKTGEYTNSAGETKGRWQNIGALMESDDGYFLMIDRTFNPAGVPNPKGSSACVVSCFAVKDRDSAGTVPRDDAPRGSSFEDEIPF